jgi:3-hydroxyisobutyrate dehydrogenase-like beta-hydroxyacid dehydrogenase
MSAERIGILHPGQMGIVVAATARNSGNEVFWVSEGRSAETRERAVAAGLKDAGTVEKLCEMCAVIVSVCPPEFAEQMAEQVASCSYQGVYVDANAISPERVRRMARRMEESGASFVDGGIIGPPATKRDQTWLYLAGERAAEIAQCFSAGPMEVEALSGGIGRASALKMCFAAYSKGCVALAAAVLGAAKELEVLEDLKRQWARNGPSVDALEREISRAAPKAWRFTGEMQEIAATFQSAGMPAGFHQAAEQIFERLAQFKGREQPPMGGIFEAFHSGATLRK